MFVKAKSWLKGNNVVLLNINHIAYIGGIEDDCVKVLLNTPVQNATENIYKIAISDLLEAIAGEHCEAQIVAWLHAVGWEDKTEEIVEEPNTLGEICEVSFVFNRLVLTVNKGKIEASKKFGLLDNYERYEFDGNHMYFYCPDSITADFTIACGNEDYACMHSPAAVLNMSNPAHAVKRCRKVIKAEMAKQCREKMIAIPNSIASDLSRNTNCSIDDFMVMGET